MLQAYVPAEADTIPEYYKAADGTWTAMGGRARVFLVNTDLLTEQEYPDSIYDLQMINMKEAN